MPLDQTDVASGQDGSSEAVEEDSRRGAANPNPRGHPSQGWGHPAHLAAAGPPVASGVFWSIPDPSSVIFCRG